MKIQDFRKAVLMAKEMKFEECEFQYYIKSPVLYIDGKLISKGYYENWMNLFSDEDGCYYSLILHEDGWKLCHDEIPFCRVSEKLSAELDAYREWELGAEQREWENKMEAAMYREELWRNYGPGKI